MTVLLLVPDTTLPPTPHGQPSLPNTRRGISLVDPDFHPILQGWLGSFFLASPVLWARLFPVLFITMDTTENNWGPSIIHRPSTL